MNPDYTPFDLAAQFVPSSLAGMISPEHFMFISGFAGMLSAFIVLTIWSRGL